jgi:uncharacterized protein (TIGR02145 family)
MKLSRLSILYLTILIIFIFQSNSCSDDKTNTIPYSITDIDGNIYHSVIIGSQVWLIENLKVTHYRNGDPIQTTHNYDYDLTPSNSQIFGRLYNWYAVTDSRKLCPPGWHIPTDAEWKTLINYLGGDSIAGGKLKARDTVFWKSPNTGATNESGFNALPGGYCYNAGEFSLIFYSAAFWSSTEISSGNAWNRYLAYDLKNIYRYNASKYSGFSVRCLKD